MESGTAVATTTFADRLAGAVAERRSQLVVGLDPRLDLLPLELRGDAHVGRPAAAEATARFCCGIVDAVAPYCVAVKPQLAFFEVLGSDGIAAFERVARYARSAGLLVIVDGKYMSNRVPSHAAMPALIDTLVAKARAERPKG